MRVLALHLGKHIAVKAMQSKLNLKSSFKDPLVIEYSKGGYVVVIKYGVVVFWGLSEGDINKFLLILSPFVDEAFENRHEEEMTLRVGKKVDEIKNDEIHMKSLDVAKVALISMILARSLALEYFEVQVEKTLKEFETVIAYFTHKGRIPYSAKSLLKKVGIAMSVQHGAVSQMALLDKPDFTWNDGSLDLLYGDLAEEFELDDRYEIVSEKLKILFHNVEFILNLVAERRGLILELVIIFLILVEVVFFVLETWVLK